MPTDAILPTKIELEKRLQSNFPTTQIAFPSQSFTPPAPDVLYLRCQLQIGRPEDPVIGVKYRRENLTFQVFVMAPYNKGEAEAFTKAKLITDAYQRGTSIAGTNILIQIFKSPTISGSMIIDNRLVAPVLIPVVVQVFN